MQWTERLDFKTQLQFVKGAGPARAGMLESKGLRTVSAPVAYAPLRHKDRTRVKAIAQLAPGELATVLAPVHSGRASRMANRQLELFEATFADVDPPTPPNPSGPTRPQRRNRRGPLTPAQTAVSSNAMGSPVTSA
ncbi:MAG: hypothetical protein JNN08_06085 [Bryobacterales bacterium]|nr:hypothetical protein [Bryobacterales bacterium]